jgi:hypothetical protein
MALVLDSVGSRITKRVYNLRLDDFFPAVRKLADNGLLAPELASTCVKGVESKGIRLGNWLSVK